LSLTGYKLPPMPVNAVSRGGERLSHLPPFAILHDRINSL